MKKKIILIVLFLLTAAFVGTVIINIAILPTKAKAYIIKTLEEKLGRKVTIESLRYIPPATFSLNKILIYQDSAETSVLANIENTKLSFSVIPLLIKKKVISTLDIHNFLVRDVKLNGSVRTYLDTEPTSPFKFKGTVRLVNLSLDTGFLPQAIERLNGVIDIQKDGIRIDNAYFYFGNTSYELKGGLKNMKEPEIALSLGSNGFRSEGRFLLKDGYLQIEKLNATLGESSLSLIGDISNFSRPLLNLYGESKINLADLGKATRKKDEDPKFKGVCESLLFFKGELGDLENCELGFKTKADRLSLQGFIFDDFDMDLRMKDGILTTPRLNTRFYDGLLSASISSEPFANGRPYSAEISLQNASLARWAKEAKFGKKIAGIVSSRFLLKGYASNVDTLSGGGWLSIADGYIWEAPLLGGIAGILTVPNLRSIVFREAAGNFSIGGRKINISDLVFYSDDVNISIKGDIDFDSNLDLLVNTNITQEIIQGSSEAAQIANILIQQAGQFLGRVRITGTLDDPQYKVMPGVKKVQGVKPIEKVFKNQIGDFLKDIFE